MVCQEGGKITKGRGVWEIFEMQKVALWKQGKKENSLIKKKKNKKKNKTILTFSKFWILNWIY